jgi:hypothetical protein
VLDKPNQQVLSALAMLEGNKDFEMINSWLTASLQLLDAVSRETQDITVCRWRQGAAQAVAQYLEYTVRAREIIRKSR